MNVKEIVGFDRHIQETVVMISQPGIREYLISSRRHMGNQAGSRQSSSAWLEQPAWLDQTELQYRVQFIHILLFLSYIEKQMEFFFSPVKSCNMSTWKSPEEMFAIGWQKLEGDWVNHAFITFKWTNHICCCELAISKASYWCMGDFCTLTTDVVSKKAVGWFSNYLADRYQCVCHDGSSSGV